MHTRNRNRIQRNIEALRRNGGGIKEETFWEFRKKISSKRNERKVAMKNKEGELQTEPEEIKKVFKDFYNSLFKVDIDESEEAKTKEEIGKILAKGQEQEVLLISKDDIIKAKKTLKKNKAGDQEGWNNEMILYGGSKMIEALEILFNRKMKELRVPTEWEDMEVVSIYKNKGSRNEMKNRRGIFLTSILSKLLEKVISEKTTNNLKTSCFQNGGRKNRSAKDNWLAMMAVIDKNKYIGRETYILFADAVKCFDKLWLDDCIKDMVKDGMREREAALIHRMNEKANMNIVTPFGSAGKIEKKYLVKQGTIFGPQLCCSSTLTVNDIGSKTKTVVSPMLSIESLVYVDDIEAVGSKKTIELAGENLRKMEEMKGFTFGIGNGKTQYIKINNKGRKSKKEEEELQIILKNRIYSHKNTGI